MIINIESADLKIKVKQVALDTNILLWTFYGNIIYAKSYQKNIYPQKVAEFIEDKNCTLYTTIYNLCEMFNIIEKNEYELYLEEKGLSMEQFSRKDYRQLTLEREKIKETMQVIYNQIKSCIEIEEYNLNEQMLQQYIQMFDEHQYDMFDFSLIQFCKEKNIPNIMTDDIDFLSCESMLAKLNVLTANRKRNI